MAIHLLQTGLIYRNPHPHVRSIHAYFPSVAVMANGDMLATVVLGEAFESVNLHAWVCRSRDHGVSWQMEGRLDSDAKDPLVSDTARIAALPDGSIMAFIMRLDRSGHPEEGLTSHATLGFVPVQLRVSRSSDFGRTWESRPLVPPLEGPGFEMCCPIVPLADGRLILPTQTWPGWNGECPNGIRMVAFVSHDAGRTWPEYMNVMNEPGGKTFFWESKIIELPDRRLLAVAWMYDDVAKCDGPNPYALSADGGRTWSPRRSTGLFGQTLTPCLLPDGRILSVYRRMDKPGLWANLSRLEDQRWIHEAEAPLWGNAAQGLTQTTADMAHNFNVLRFGAPTAVLLRDGTIFVACWCYEDCVSGIRWFKLKVA